MWFSCLLAPPGESFRGPWGRREEWWSTELLSSCCVWVYTPALVHCTALITCHHSSLPFQVFGSHRPNHKLACSPSSISHRTVNLSLLYDLCSRVWVKWDFKMEKVRLDVIIPSLRTLHCLSLLGPRSKPIAWLSLFPHAFPVSSLLGCLSFPNPLFDQPRDHSQVSVNSSR